MEVISYRILAVVLLQILRQGIIVGSFGLFTVIPTSQNVTLDTNVVFSCGTNDSSLIIQWFYSYYILASQFSEQLLGVGFVSKVQVTAVSEYNKSTFSCYLLNGTDFEVLTYKEALLMIQGNNNKATKHIL